MISTGVRLIIAVILIIFSIFPYSLGYLCLPESNRFPGHPNADSGESRVGKLPHPAGSGSLLDVVSEIRSKSPGLQPCFRLQSPR